MKMGRRKRYTFFLPSRCIHQNGKKLWAESVGGESVKPSQEVRTRNDKKAIGQQVPIGRIIGRMAFSWKKLDSILSSGFLCLDFLGILVICWRLESKGKEKNLVPGFVLQEIQQYQRWGTGKTQRPGPTRGKWLPSLFHDWAQSPIARQY